jgi:hypothetical protein
MLKKIKLNKKRLNGGAMTEKSFGQTVQSYLGMLGHCRGRKIEEKINRIRGVKD